MRPLKAGLDYFPHDTDAMNDPKIKSLMAMHGCEGYTFYFILLETIFRTENARITCGKPIEKAGLARSMCLSIKRFDSILETALELECFDPSIYQETKQLTSNGIQKRIAKVNDLRSKERLRKETIKEKLKYKKKTTAGKRTENPRKTLKSKFGEFNHVLLTDEEVIKLKEKFNSNFNYWIKTLDEGIEQKGYKYNSHYLTILKWAEKERNKGESIADQYPEL